MSEMSKLRVKIENVTDIQSKNPTAIYGQLLWEFQQYLLSHNNENNVKICKDKYGQQWFEITHQYNDWKIYFQLYPTTNVVIFDMIQCNFSHNLLIQANNWLMANCIFPITSSFQANSSEDYFPLNS